MGWRINNGRTNTASTPLYKWFITRNYLYVISYIGFQIENKIHIYGERIKLGKLKTSILYLPRPATKYPGCYPLHFERRLPEILETNNYVHFFSGKATSGYRIDINSKTEPNLVADIHNTPFEDNYFNGGMADPPYTKEFAETLYGTEYPVWSIWTKELVRIVCPGGRIGIMHNYIVPRLKGCDMEEIIVILTRIKQYPKIVTVQRKR